MKNIYLSALYKVRDNAGPANVGGCKMDCGATYAAYKRLYDVSSQSFLNNLQAIDQHVLFEGEFDHIQDGVRECLFFTHKLWKDNAPCNILYAAPDTACLRPTMLFGRFAEFRMFNRTPMRNRRKRGFDRLLNADVKYFPFTMDESVWINGLKMAREQWNYGDWNSEQLVLHAMMWEWQNVPEDDWFHPELAFQAYVPRPLRYNGIPLSEAHIVHLAGSRGADAALVRMKELLGIA